jgi:hypothetical protein
VRAVPPSTTVTGHGEDASRRDPLPRGAALVRGLLGWGVLCAGLGLAVGLAAVLQQRAGLAGAARVLVQAGLMALLVVPAVLVLRRRLDRRSTSSLGLGRRLGRPVLLGVGVGLGSGAAVWWPAVLAGWVRVDGVDLTTHVRFLLLNGLALLLFEALPEELALRGYTWTNLRDGWGAGTATLLSTALFPFSAGMSSVVSAGVTGLLGTRPLPLQAFPDDPVVYVLQLLVFGLALVAARRVRVPAALWVAIAFHWTQLTVTRTLLGGLGWVDSGWRVTFVQPDALALVLVHVVVAGALFVALRHLHQRRGGHVRTV